MRTLLVLFMGTLFALSTAAQEKMNLNDTRWENHQEIDSKNKLEEYTLIEFFDSNSGVFYHRATNVKALVIPFTYTIEKGKVQLLFSENNTGGKVSATIKLENESRFTILDMTSNQLGKSEMNSIYQKVDKMSGLKYSKM